MWRACTESSATPGEISAPTLADWSRPPVLTIAYPGAPALPAKTPLSLTLSVLTAIPPATGAAPKTCASAAACAAAAIVTFSRAGAAGTAGGVVK